MDFDRFKEIGKKTTTANLSAPSFSIKKADKNKDYAENIKEPFFAVLTIWIPKSFVETQHPMLDTYQRVIKSATKIDSLSNMTNAGELYITSTDTSHFITLLLPTNKPMLTYIDHKDMSMGIAMNPTYRRILPKNDPIYGDTGFDHADFGGRSFNFGMLIIDGVIDGVIELPISTIISYGTLSKYRDRYSNIGVFFSTGGKNPRDFIDEYQTKFMTTPVKYIKNEPVDLDIETKYLNEVYKDNLLVLKGISYENLVMSTKSLLNKQSATYEVKEDVNDNSEVKDNTKEDPESKKK